MSVGNCFRVRGFVYGRVSQDLVQFEGTGSLFHVIVLLISYTNKLNDRIQQVVIEQLLDESICVENAVLEDLAALSHDPSIDLREEETKLRKEYDALYRDEYEPPKVTIEYDSYGPKKIIIERPKR